MAKLVDAASKRRWDSILLWGFLVSLALVRAGHLEEKDPYWQIRAGIENLAGMPLARPDTWTWSGVEGNWYPNSPLWNIVLAIAYQAGGFWGFFVLSAVMILALLGVTHLLARRLGARPLPGLLGMMVVYAAAFPMLNARATLVVQILLLAAIYLALRFSDVAGTVSHRVLIALVLASALGLSTLGNWIHLSFLVLGPALASVWALIWVLTPGLTWRYRLTLIASGAIGWLLGTVLSPYGVIEGLARTRAVQLACEGLIVEWASPFDPYVPPQFWFVAAAALLLAVGTAVWLVRRWRAGAPVRDLAALAMVGVPSAFAGFVAIRFLGVSLLVLAPVAAAIAPGAVDWLRRGLAIRPLPNGLKARLQEYASGPYWRIVLTATLVVLSPGVVLLGAQHGEPPEQAIAAALPPGCRLFVRPGLASAVVLLRPDVPVWMDGRADFFGREMLLSSYAYLGGTSKDVVPEGTTCILLDLKSDIAPLRARLSSSRDWRLDSDSAFVELWLPVEGS